MENTDDISGFPDLMHHINITDSTGDACLTLYCMPYIILYRQTDVQFWTTIITHCLCETTFKIGQQKPN